MNHIPHVEETPIEVPTDAIRMSMFYHQFLRLPDSTIYKDFKFRCISCDMYANEGVVNLLCADTKYNNCDHVRTSVRTHLVLNRPPPQDPPEAQPIPKDRPHQWVYDGRGLYNCNNCKRTADSTTIHKDSLSRRECPGKTRKHIFHTSGEQSEFVTCLNCHLTLDTRQVFANPNAMCPY